MPDYTLRDPDGNTIVTGDGSERGRLVGQGYEDITDRPAARTEPVKAEPVKSEPKPVTNKPA